MESKYYSCATISINRTTVGAQISQGLFQKAAAKHDGNNQDDTKSVIGSAAPMLLRAPSVSLHVRLQHVGGYTVFLTAWLRE